MIPSPVCGDCVHFEPSKMRLGYCRRGKARVARVDAPVSRVLDGGPCDSYDPTPSRIAAARRDAPGYQTIADVVFRMRRHLPQKSSLSLVEQGAVSSILEVGVSTSAEMPLLVNFGVMGRLTLLAQPFRVHELTAAAVRTVAETDLHSMPLREVELLRHPFIVQVRNPKEETLFGSTTSIGGYHYEDRVYLIGLDYPDGSHVVRWFPKWGGEELSDGVVREDCLGADELEQWGRDAARFVVVLGALLEASGTPIRTADAGPRLPGHGTHRDDKARPWAVRRVNISGETSHGSGVHCGSGGGNSGALELSRSVMVRGHLKRQRFGAGLAQEKWIYVDSYQARRWFTTKPTRIVVS